MIKPFLQIASTEAGRKTVIDLLVQHNLPVDDIDNVKQLFAFLENEKIIGTAGLEVFNDCALLRSISVIKEEQHKGYGKIITAEIEKFATQNGVSILYLLTTTAKDFFEKNRYVIINREDVPASIKQTTEFSSLCPASAIVMKKEI